MSFHIHGIYSLCYLNFQPLLRSTSFTSDALKKASVQWYKMKWQFTGSANDLWGEEVQGYAVMGSQHPLGGKVDIFRPGKVNQIRLRFFNLTHGDDASNDFRSAFLKVSSTHFFYYRYIPTLFCFYSSHKGPV